MNLSRYWPGSTTTSLDDSSSVTSSSVGRPGWREGELLRRRRSAAGLERERQLGALLDLERQRQGEQRAPSPEHLDDDQAVALAGRRQPDVRVVRLQDVLAVAGAAPSSHRRS